MPDGDKILTREEVLQLLSKKAREGSTSAMIALERALRARERAERESVEDELDRVVLTK